VAVAPGDVTSGVDRGRMLDTAVRTWGRLDVLVNSAGRVGATGPLERLREEEWSALLAVDLTAPLLLAKEALPLLRKQGGSILNISSGASLRPVSGFGAYAAAKAGLNYVSQVLALEAAPRVRVNVICPGGTDTPIFSTFLESEEKIAEIKKRFAEMTPLGRIGHPRDIAAAALFLSSDAAQWVTGAVLTVDGGMNLE
jgi:3-oxoacyl-[acyl-carrier protein] reductase